jgi:LCP family protein required for cell wall assembly
VLLGLGLALVLYLFLPLGTQRVVLLGSDARADEASRSDTILVTAAGGHDGILAVPRDTLVQIPGVGEDKVNAAFANGGADLTVQTLEGFMDRRIDNYVVLNFEGVGDIVDAMGGVSINVEQQIDPVEAGGPSLSPGEQTLNGEEALTYVRYRGDPTADIGRVGRQQEFVQSVISQALSPTNLPQFPATISAILSSIETNMNPLEAARFLIQLRLAGDRATDIYPGTPQYINGISYWVPDTDSGEQVMRDTIG